jgi:carbonic anhydrase
MATSDDVRPTGDAISRLQRVEFRQTLRGYHIDDVHEFLNRVTAEVEHLLPGHISRSEWKGTRSFGAYRGGDTEGSAISSLRTIEFRQTLRGYHIDEVDRYLEELAIETDALLDGRREIGLTRGSRSVRPDLSPSPVGHHPRPPAVSAGTVVASELTVVPRTGWAVVTCMDTRVEIGTLFGGIGPGDAHVIRNAGGIVTDDTIRSLAISQRLGMTDAVLLVHHTDCGLLTIDDEAFAQEVALEAGVRPTWNAGAFANLEDDVRRSMARVHASPFIQRKGEIRGFVYDVRTGHLVEVDPSVGWSASITSGTGTQMWAGWW